MLQWQVSASFSPVFEMQQKAWCNL